MSAALRSCRLLSLVLGLCTPVLAGGQRGGEQARPVGRMLAPGVLATIRFSETLDVPRKRAPSLPVRAEIGTLLLQNAGREITVPAQGFYVAEVRNADLKVTVGGNEVLHHAGDVWTVAAGQAMIVRFASSIQQNAMLFVLSLAPAD